MFCKQTCAKIVLDVFRNNYITIRCKSEVKMTKQLMKMINKGPKKKAWYSQPQPVALNSLSQPRRKGPTDGQRRRAVQVGKVLYEYIVQIVNSGELCPQLADLAVSIDRVSVVADFSAINVHWLASGDQEEKKIETLLKENAGKLRHILTSYHLLGRIPIINFVKDEIKANSEEVEKLLKIADFGPDFEPATFSTPIRTGVRKQNIEQDFAKLSLEHTDWQSYPNIMTVTESGALVFETSKRANGLDIISKELDAHLKESVNATERDNVMVKEQSNFIRNQERTDNISVDKDFAKGSSHFNTGLEPSQLITFDKDDKSNNTKHQNDLNDVTFRNDLYSLQYDSLMRKLLMKKRRVKHRMASETFISDSFKNAESTDLKGSPDYTAFLRKRKKLKPVKGKRLYTVEEYLRDEGTDYWNVRSQDVDNVEDDGVPEEET